MGNLAPEFGLLAIMPYANKIWKRRIGGKLKITLPVKSTINSQK